MDIIKVFEDVDEIATAALDYVLQAAAESIDKNGVFNLVLAGGSTPEKLYRLLAQSDADWSKWQFFMGDERFVSLTDERSNFRLVRETILNKLSISDEQVHPVSVDASSVEKAADEYEKHIQNYFKGAQPAFDLILLGMGSDGHTASLFPGEPAISVTDRLVVASEPGVLPPPVDRVTFTFPLINAGRRVLFMAAGQDKAEVFAQVRQDLEKTPAEAITPAGKVRPDGELHWFVDRALAG